MTSDKTYDTTQVLTLTALEEAETVMWRLHEFCNRISDWNRQLPVERVVELDASPDSWIEQMLAVSDEAAEHYTLEYSKMLVSMWSQVAPTLEALSSSDQFYSTAAQLLHDLSEMQEKLQATHHLSADEVDTSALQRIYGHNVSPRQLNIRCGHTEYVAQRLTALVEKARRNEDLDLPISATLIDIESASATSIDPEAGLTLQALEEAEQAASLQHDFWCGLLHWGNQLSEQEQERLNVSDKSLFEQLHSLAPSSARYYTNPFVDDMVAMFTRTGDTLETLAAVSGDTFWSSGVRPYRDLVECMENVKAQGLRTDGAPDVDAIHRFYGSCVSPRRVQVLTNHAGQMTERLTALVERGRRALSLNLPLAAAFLEEDSGSKPDSDVVTTYFLLQEIEEAVDRIDVLEARLNRQQQVDLEHHQRLVRELTEGDDPPSKLKP